MATSTDSVDGTTLVHSLHHVNFPISDIAATEEWYWKVFGMSRGGKPRDPNYVSPNPNGLFLQTPDGRFHLHFNHNDKPVPQDVHFAIEVEDWDGFLAHLDSLGIKPELRGTSDANPGQAGRRPNDNSMTGHIRDPDGYAVEITYHPDREW